MKLIRNRKMLRAKRRRYSHLMKSFRCTIHEGAQEMQRLQAMLDWLVKNAPGEYCPENMSCNHEPDKLYPASDCWECWKNAAEKAVQDADGK